MKHAIATAIFGLTVAITGPAFADSANWSDEKAAEVEQNRFADSGYGNGGEKADGRDRNYENSKGPNPDVDPGNSGNQCQGGKNEYSGGC